jgi:hypothetical protein
MANFLCYYCNYEATSESELIDHLTSSGAENTGLACVVTLAMLKSKNSLAVSLIFAIRRILCWYRTKVNR